MLGDRMRDVESVLTIVGVVLEILGAFGILFSLTRYNSKKLYKSNLIKGSLIVITLGLLEQMMARFTLFAKMDIDIGKFTLLTIIINLLALVIINFFLLSRESKVSEKSDNKNILNIKGIATFILFIAIIGLVSLFLKTKFMANGEVFGDNQSDVVAALYGLTSGILALVGLVSIFVSLNSQQTIQKARELFWNVQELMHDQMMWLSLKSDPERPKFSGDTIYQRLVMYRSLLESSDGFTKVIIKYAQLAIICVWIMWFCIIVLLKLSLWGNIFMIISTIAAIGVTSLFYFVLQKLGNVPAISQLPRYNDICDGKIRTNPNIDTSVLLALTTKLHIFHRNEGTTQIYISFPFPFKGFQIKARGSVIYEGEYEGKACLVREKFSGRLKDLNYESGSPNLFVALFEKERFENLPKPTYTVNWHKIISFKDKNNITGVQLELMLVDGKSQVKVDFNIGIPEENKGELNSVSYPFRVIQYPTKNYTCFLCNKNEESCECDERALNIKYIISSKGDN